jgi:hypothetical protein
MFARVWSIECAQKKEDKGAENELRVGRPGEIVAGGA